MIQAGKLLPLVCAEAFIPGIASGQQNQQTPPSDFRLENSRIILSQGRSYMNGYPVKLHDKIAPKSRFVIPMGSELVFQVADGSTFRLFEGSLLTFEVGRNYVAQLKLDEGMLSSVVIPEEAQYLISTNLISFQVTKSVSFTQKISPETGYSTLKGEGVEIENNDNDYLFCLCNGHLEVLSNQDQRSRWLTSTSYHKAIFIKELDGQVRITQTAPYNHTDGNIRDQINMSTVALYPTDWLML